MAGRTRPAASYGSNRRLPEHEDDDTMTEKTRSALTELQRLDQEIEEAHERVGAFDPAIEEVEEPALALEREVGTTRGRLQEMRLEERRLEVTAQEKRTRVKKLEERLAQVRNVREESAVSAELGMVKSALEGDEMEALSLLEQIRKLELKLEEQESLLEQARADVEPRRDELVAQRAEARALMEANRASRDEFAQQVDERELRLYEAIRSGGRRRAVASLTADGACGHCYGVVPLQLQNEIQHGGVLLRCEACGVILTAASEEDDEAAADADGSPADADGSPAEA